MQIHELKSKTERIKPMKIGRGGKRGKTAGRGTKGQKARSGHRMYPEIRDMIKKLPKLRGRGININKAFALKNAPVTLADLENNFTAGERVTPQSLFDKGLIKKVGGKIPPVKILAKGEITKKIIIKNCLISESVKNSVTKAGGKII